MKVGLVGTHVVGCDGAAASDDLARLATALAARRADVTVYGCRPDGDDGPDVVDTEAGYRVVRLPGASLAGVSDAEPDAVLAPLMGDFARFLSDQWVDDRPDVVHSESWIYGVATQLAADRYGIASVQSLPQLSAVVHRRQGRHVGPAARPRFERLLARSASRMVAACTEDVLELAKLGCPRKRVAVLPQAVDVERFSPIGPASDRTNEYRVVAVGRELAPHKGFDDVVRALPRLPSTELVVIGGPEQHLLDWDAGACRLRSLALDLGVGDRVHLTGRVARDRLPGILRSADALVSPSWYEPFGLPVVEAMSCGVPVVASEAGGMLDTVVHDVTGMLVPARNPVKLAKALDDVLHGGPLRGGMGLAGRVRARSRFCWERVAAETYTAYEVAVEEFTTGAGRRGEREGPVPATPTA